MNKKAWSVAVLAAIAGTAHAQVIINEVCHNPPGADEDWEYIELYGRPGMSLDGYAIALYKGGADPDGDDIANTPTEVDEAFSLDGLSLGVSGFLVLVNDTAGTPESTSFIDPDATVGNFETQHIPAPDSPGKLANGDSSTYLLIRARPNYRFENGMSIYEPGYAVRKEGIPDDDFDGKIDFGFETTGAEEHDPMQIVDDIAWSNNGGKEFVRSSEQEISDTPGFDPDAITRLSYLGANPEAGHRVKSSGEVVSTRMADESWIYGEIARLPVTLADRPEFGTGTGGEIPKGPTDPSGPTYDCPPGPTGEGDCFQDAGGSFLFDDIALLQNAGQANEIGFHLTPGTFNDDARFGVTQFRFVAADFDFDGDADQDDLALIQSRVGATLDDLIPCTDPDTGAPIVDPFTMTGFDCYEYEGRAFNALESMRNMDMTDGPGGVNADEVTNADVAAAMVIIPPARLCADVNQDGSVTPTDFGAWLAAFNSGDLLADTNQDGSVTPTDFGAWLAAFNQGAGGPTCNP